MDLKESFFLSNFYSAPVEYNGLTFQNNEATFQAMKCPSRAKEFINLSPSDAKRLGRKVKLRADWEEVKESVMYLICYQKFKQNEELRESLINTGDSELIEDNTWGDRIWGMCNGVCKNLLGKILMRVREEMKG